MNKQRYIAPITEVIHCGNFCETLPVYWSQEGPGDVGAKEMDFDDDNWFSDGVKDYTEIWQSESEKWQ